jgi:aspartate aminotransferase/aminotransferase
MIEIAQRMSCIEASGIRRIWQMAANMKDPVNFSIGEPDFAAPAAVKQAAIEAIQADRNSYTVTAGLPALRQEIARRIEQEFGWQDPVVLITAGLSGALVLALMATVDPGDGVIIPDPYFVSYRHLTNLQGGVCQFVDTYPDFRLTDDRLRAAITGRTKVLLVNSPANPTGAVCTEAQLRAVGEAAHQADLLVISDEIYRDFNFDARGPAPSVAHHCRNTLVLRGFSKSLGVPGWRLGYVAAPKSLAHVIDAMATLQQYTFVCAPHPFQHAALAGLDVDMSGPLAAYRRKRDLVYEGLRDHFELIRPQGAFYAFVRAPGGQATPFVERAIGEQVLVIPGWVFSEQDTHFRISYATSDEQIRRGVQRLRQLAESF